MPRTDVAVYCRISQDRLQTAEGVKRQEADARRLAKERRWNVLEVLIDNDLSAYSGKRRPAYERLCELIKEGAVQAVIAWHPDRLHRSVKELESFIDLIDAAQAEVVFVKAGPWDLTTATGRLVARMGGAIARHESEHMAERQRRKRNEMAAKGLFNGGQRPFGWEADGTTLRPDEADAIREAADRILNGWSVRGIARAMTVPPVRSADGRWRWVSLRAVLTNPRVAGLRVHNGKVVAKAAWEPVLDEETWQRVCGLIADPARKRRRPESSYLLSGLIVTSEGARMSGHRSQGKRYYSFNDGHRCGMKVLADPVEKVVTTRAFELDATGVESGLESPEVTYGRMLEQVQGELRKLAERYRRGELSYDEWEIMRERPGQKLAEMQRVPFFFAPRRVKRERPLAELWDGMDLPARKQALRDVITAVVVHPARPGATRFDTERIVITPR